MLLSGFGLFYSLLKYETSGDSILKWYKKRYARILIPYILWYVVHLVRAYNTPDTDWLQFLYGFSLIKYWTHDSGAWFLSVLVPLYALSTAFMKILSWGHFCRNTIVALCFTSVATCLHSDCYTLNTIYTIMPHISAFLIGMSLAYCFMQNRSICIWWFLLYSVVLLALFVFVERNFAVLYLSSCMFTLPVLVHLLKWRDNGNKTLCWFGSISLESYLTNGALPHYVAMIPWCVVSCNLNYGNYLGYSIVIVGGLLWAWCLHIASKWLLTKLKII